MCLLPTPGGLTPQTKNLVALIALMTAWWITREDRHMANLWRLEKPINEMDRIFSYTLGTPQA